MNTPLYVDKSYFEKLLKRMNLKVNETIEQIKKNTVEINLLFEFDKRTPDYRAKISSIQSDNFKLIDTPICYHFVSIDFKTSIHIFIF